jgi:hypothetical protein
MTTRTGSCSCGQLRVEAVGDPIRISICHCLECQRRTGSVFGVQARFHTNSVTVRGQWMTFRRVGDSGTEVTFRFCPACGGTVHYTLERHPEIVGVPVGAFADPNFPMPGRSVYEVRMHAWVNLPADIEHLP